MNLGGVLFKLFIMKNVLSYGYVFFKIKGKIDRLFYIGNCKII